MNIQRDFYLNQLIAGRENGLIKIITGIRRCGKSYLLFNLFHEIHIEKYSSRKRTYHQPSAAI